MTKQEGDCPNIKIDNTKEEVLKELAVLKDSIRKIESNCNKSISFLQIKTDAIEQELSDFMKSNNRTNYELGVWFGQLDNRFEKQNLKLKNVFVEISKMLDDYL